MRDIESGGELKSSALVRDIKANDQRAIGKLYEYFNTIVRCSLARKMGPPGIDDKVHELFLMVFDAIRRDKLRDPAALPGFIKATVHRQVAAEIGRRVRDRRTEQSVDKCTRPGDVNLETNAIREQQRQLVRSVLACLEGRKREILVRFYLAEQPQQQIMDEMGLTDTQYRLLKSRAKAELDSRAKQHLKFCALRQSVRTNIFAL